MGSSEEESICFWEALKLRGANTLLQIQNENSATFICVKVYCFQGFYLQCICCEATAVCMGLRCGETQGLFQEAGVIPQPGENFAPVLISELLNLHKQPSPKP